MCGIGLCVKIYCTSPSKECTAGLNPETLELLQRRGPDCYATEEVKENTASVTFFSAVLGLRGRRLSIQPARDEIGNMLAWNGEIFGGPKVSDQECDTTFLLNMLARCSSESELLNIISSIEGPWTLVYFKRSEQQLWFGRDIFGRRSLLFNSKGCGLTLASCVSRKSREDWTELPACGIYCLDLQGSVEAGHLSVRLFPWSQLPAGEPFDLSGWQASTLGEELACAVDPSMGPPLNRDLPGQEVPTMPPMGRSFFRTVLSEKQQYADAVAELGCILSEAVRCRLSNHQMVCRLCLPQYRSGAKDFSGCDHAAIAVLFSGGLDSMVIAALCARLLPRSCSVDLLNVSFQHQVHMVDSQKKTKKWFTSFEAPDRISAKLGVDELRRAFPDCRWNLVEINVTKEELLFERSHHIGKLIYPLETVLDESLGCALWFAARGIGNIVLEDGTETSYECPARVVLLGMGADEQLGGYSRHVVKYKNFGWQGLVDEIAMELNRISSRNLGRDDRIVSDHGREPRFPFLDRNVVKHLNQIPIWMKVNPHLPRGIGDKLLLRLLAFNLGLEEAACRPKRAMQFGSRIVHAEQDRAKGSDVCKRLRDLDLGSIPDSELAYWKS